MTSSPLLVLPVTCYLCYGDFCDPYMGKCGQLIGCLQKQGVILNERQCPNCEQECRIDFNLKLFQDKSIINPSEAGRGFQRCCKSFRIGHKQFYSHVNDKEWQKKQDKRSLITISMPIYGRKCLPHRFSDCRFGHYFPSKCYFHIKININILT